MNTKMHCRSTGWSGRLGLALLLGISATAQAQTATNGVLACAGNNFSRLNGDEQHRTIYNVRNLSLGTINITRIVTLDANGAVLFDGIPSPAAGFKSQLGPFQASQIRSSQDLGLPNLGRADRPVTTAIFWSSANGTPVETPRAGTVRLARGADGKERGRHRSDCQVLNL